MQQGEVSRGVNAQTFDYKPFNPDGTINYDSQEVTFTVSFNRPTDYDFSTGIMNVNSTAGAPKETFAFIATSCKNVFSKGQFTQELSGSLLPLASNPSTSANANGRPTASTAALASGSRQPGTGFGDDQETYTTDSLGNTFKDGTLSRAAEVDEDVAPPTTQPANPPEAPTSSGDIDFNAGLAGSGEVIATPPQDINKET